jgi:uncharacterized protein (TIGR00730 family)
MGKDKRYAQVAHEFGTRCAEEQVTLYYGGGCVGLMGVAADAALAKGGKVIGIAPDFFAKGTILSLSITELILVKTMSERKQQLESLADAFVVLPGSLGTMDEFFEVLTNTQLGLHQKPVVLLNAYGYYDGLLSQIARFRDEGFLHPAHHDLLLTAASVEELFSLLHHLKKGSFCSIYDKKNTAL